MRTPKHRKQNRGTHPSILFKVKGFKNTQSRLAIFLIFQRALSPLSCNEIVRTMLEKKIKTNTATVYRTLEIFKKHGLIIKTGKQKTISSAGETHLQNLYEIT